MVQIAAEPRPPAGLAVGPAADRRRREILAAASRLFRARGLHATGMREIAAALGMTAGNLYYYFPSKQHLLAFCQEATLAELLARAAAIRASGKPSDEQLRALIASHVEVLNSVTPGSLAHLEIEEIPPARRRALLARRRSYERHLSELVEAGQRSGRFRPADPKLAALALLGALNWTVKWFDEKGAKTAEQVGAEFADLLVGGLLEAGARAGEPPFRSGKRRKSSNEGKAEPDGAPRRRLGDIEKEERRGTGSVAKRRGARAASPVSGSISWDGRPVAGAARQPGARQRTRRKVAP